jgi:hypothetical protein
VRKPPKCAVSPINATPTNSTGIRSRGSSSDRELRERQCTHQDRITITAAIEAAATWNNNKPLSFSPSSANSHAKRPVSTVGTTITAAIEMFKYAALASCDSRLPRDSRSNPTPVINNAIGKWISTTCCACFASRIVRRSKGLTIFVIGSVRLNVLRGSLIER